MVSRPKTLRISEKLRRTPRRSRRARGASPAAFENKLNPNSYKPPAPPVDEVLVSHDFAASTGEAGGFHVRFIL
jgi:hypothetical protein